MLGHLVGVDETATLDVIDRVGRGSSEIWRAIWPPGSKTVAPFSLPGRTALDFFLLRYPAATGEVSTVAIGAYRQQTSPGQPVRFWPSTRRSSLGICPRCQFDGQ